MRIVRIRCDDEPVKVDVVAEVGVGGPTMYSATVSREEDGACLTRDDGRPLEACRSSAEAALNGMLDLLDRRYDEVEIVRDDGTDQGEGED